MGASFSRMMKQSGATHVLPPKPSFRTVDVSPMDPSPAVVHPENPINVIEHYNKLQSSIHSISLRVNTKVPAPSLSTLKNRVESSQSAVTMTIAELHSLLASNRESGGGEYKGHGKDIKQFLNLYGAFNSLSLD